MSIDMRNELEEWMKMKGIALDSAQLPDVSVDPESITMMMISEAPPPDPDDGFYSRVEGASFPQTALALLRDSGLAAESMQDVINQGIYITTAIKTPKEGLTVDIETIQAQLPVLEREMALFPDLKVLMLMGDVAKRALNLIARKNTKKTALPSTPTYKIRNQEFFYGDLRVYPSYILAGKNLLIERGKCGMIVEDIRRMLAYRDGDEEKA